MNTLTAIRLIPDNHVLVTDSQDVREILADIGKPELLDDYHGLFVFSSDGEYQSIYAFCGIVPYLSKLAVKVL